jgi:hypothetical protein
MHAVAPSAEILIDSSFGIVQFTTLLLQDYVHDLELMSEA